jgi:hypothetical protein
LPRWRQSFLWTHLVFRPSVQDFAYLDALRRLLAEKQVPTLDRLAERSGVRRQTVWQREQRPGFREWLSTELRLVKTGVAWRDVDGTLHPPGVDVIAELLSHDRRETRARAEAAVHARESIFGRRWDALVKDRAIPYIKALR